MRPWKFLLPLLATSLCFAAQPDRITGVIDSSSRVALAQSLHPKAQAKYDQGRVEPSYELGYMTIVTVPSPAQEKALDLLLAQQQDPKSASYHKWLTPAQYADQFGLSQNDVAKITAWLRSEGFVVKSVGGGRNTIVFSGTAGQVLNAFGTEIHTYRVDAKNHVANSSPVMLPTVLNGVVASVMGLHNFLPHPVNHFGKATLPRANYYASQYPANFLAPGDVAANYDITPLYNASITGAGQTLAVIGQTDVYLSDLTNFRTGFGLSAISCTTNTSGIITSCDTSNFQYVVPSGSSDPGQSYSCGDLGEADLDIEWSGAIAQDAQIIFVNSPVTYDSNCNPTNNQGVNTALIAAIDPPSGPALAPVITMSYGICELFADAPGLDPMLQEGAAEGITILNSSDDIGSAGCDFNPPNNTLPYDGAVGGLAVSYPASSAYVTGVGGTEVSLATDSSSTYWGTSNSTNGDSLLSTAPLPLPEIPWNDDEEIALFCQGDASSDFCRQGGSPAVSGWVALGTSATAQQVQEDIWISQGGGGASNCFTNNGTVCTAGVPQPSWQSSLSVSGAPSGVRYVPDISLMASPNFPGYILCTQLSELGDTGTGSACGSGGAAGITAAVDLPSPAIIGGTSVSTPVFAGIVTLLNQYLAGASSPGLGLINPMLYTLAASAPNAFHKITSGDNDVYCQAGQPSVQPLALRCPTSGTLVIGYSASNSDGTTGYNLVNGLGSVDAYNLAFAWAATRTSTTTSISTPSTNVYQSASVTFTATVTPSTATGNVSFYSNGSTSLGLAAVSNGIATFTTTALPVGTDVVTATYGGSGTQGSSVSSNSATVTVVVPYTMSPSPATLSVPAGNPIPTQITLTPAGGFTGTVNFTPASCSNLPTGAACSFTNSGSVTLNGSSPATIGMTISTAANMAIPSVPQTVTVTGTSGGLSETTSVSLTIATTNQKFTIAPQNNTKTYSVAAGQAASVQISVSGTSPLINTSSNSISLPLNYTCTGLPSEASCNFSPSQSGVSATSLTLSISTTAPTSQLRRPFGRSSGIFYAMLLPGVFGIVFAAGSRGRRARLLTVMVVLGLSMLWLGACGGSSGSSQNNPGTPAGSYMVTVNATTGAPTGGNALTSSFNLTLTVTQ